MPKKVAVVGATGAVGQITVDLLLQRGFDDLHLLASARSAGSEVRGRRVEEATPATLQGFDVCFFSVGSTASRELVPHAVRGGAVCIDKSAAFRLEDGIPLVVPEVNGARAREHSGILANPNCCAIPLTLVLKPLHDAAGLRAVRVSTYQSASGAGAQRLQRMLGEPQAEHDLAMDWDYDGEEFEEEAKLREETRKILELPELPLSATCVRVPVPVGHAESVWIETEKPLTPEQARELLTAAPAVRVEEFPTPRQAAGGDEVLVGRIRRDPGAENGLSVFLVCDNLRKGAALNGIQIAELVLSGRAVAA
jgi:aspartate-semialdehyde dehydrogenase